MLGEVSVPNSTAPRMLSCRGKDEIVNGRQKMVEKSAKKLAWCLLGTILGETRNTHSDSRQHVNTIRITR